MLREADYRIRTLLVMVASLCAGGRAARFAPHFYSGGPVLKPAEPPRRVEIETGLHNGAAYLNSAEIGVVISGIHRAFSPSLHLSPTARHSKSSRSCHEGHRS